MGGLAWGVIVGVTVLGGIISAALSQQLTDEFKAWTPWIIERIVRYAVARLPRDQQERFGEEWRGHIGEVPGEIGRILVALSCIRAARRISFDDCLHHAEMNDLLLLLNSFNNLDPTAGLAVAFPGWEVDPMGSTEVVGTTCSCHYEEQAAHFASLIEQGGTPAALVWLVAGETGESLEAEMGWPVEICSEPLPWAADKPGYVAAFVEMRRSALARPTKLSEKEGDEQP